MPLQFAKYLKKLEVEVVVARISFQSEGVDKGKFSEDYVKSSAVIYVDEEFAKKNGLKEGSVVKITSNGKSVKLKLLYTDAAPENGAVIPNSIYASYLTDFENFKKFKATVELADGEVTKPDEIITIIKERG